MLVPYNRANHTLLVLQHTVWSKMFGSKKKKKGRNVMEETQNGDLQYHTFYSAPNIARIIKSKTMRLVVHVTRTGENSNIYRSFGGKIGSKNGILKKCA
jgi:hypothetical protein